MKWILYIMLFTAPAANVTDKSDIACLKLKAVTQIEDIEKCRPKFESKKVWSLQGTSQSEFALFDSCLRMQDELVASSNVASTMTMRTWCFCEAEKGKCPTNAQLLDAVKKVRACEKKGLPNCQADSSRQIQDFAEQSGQSASSIRLYPPP